MGNAPTVNMSTRNRISTHDARDRSKTYFGKHDWHRTVDAITLKAEWYCWFRYGPKPVRTGIYELVPQSLS
jgi:hypothetical protein